MTVNECDKFNDLNFFAVGICKTKFDKDKSSFDKPDASGPNMIPNFVFFFDFISFKN